MILLEFLLYIQVEHISGRLIYKRDMEWKCKVESHWNIDAIESHKTIDHKRWEQIEVRRLKEWALMSPGTLCHWEVIKKKRLAKETEVWPVRHTENQERLVSWKSRTDNVHMKKELSARSELLKSQFKFIYFERERHTQREFQRGVIWSLLNPVRSWPRPKSRVSPLSHPGAPEEST